MAEYGDYTQKTDKAFELKKNALKMEADRLQKQNERAMKARLASSGMTQQSGLFDKSMRQADIEGKKNLYEGIQNLEVARLSDAATKDYEQTREQQGLAQKSYYAKGLAGEKYDEATLNNLKTTDPSAYYSYLGGASQKQIEEMARTQELRDKAYESLATQFDPESASYKSDIMGLLYEMTGGQQGVKINTSASIQSKKQAMDQAKANWDAAARKKNIWGQTYHDWNDAAAKEAEKIYNKAKLEYDNLVAAQGAKQAAQPAPTKPSWWSTKNRNTVE